MRRALGASFSVLVACSLLSGGAALAQSPSPVPVLDVEWTLTQMAGDPVPGDPAITATFAQSGTLTGSGGCNTYSATWTSDGTTLTITGLLATFKACEPDVSAREDRYFELIQAAASWALDGTAVVVTTTDGSTLVFGGDQQEPQGLALVGSWVLDTLDGEAPPSGLPVTLDVAADGTLSGTACNQYSSTYTATEQGDLTVDGILSTRRSCGDADAFEARYLAALQGATGWGWQLSGGGTLRLFGQADLVFHDATSVQVGLTGQGWLLSAIDGQPADPALGQGITFGDEGTASGSGGCNTFSGPYTVDGDAITIGPLLSTRMSCGDDADTSEIAYLTALESAASFTITGTDLVISTRDGGSLEFSTQPGPQATAEATPAATPAATPEATSEATPEASAAPATAAPSPGASAAVGGSIVGTWEMTTYAGSPLPRGILNIDITFAPDGTFSGTGGCNDYSGEWKLDGTSLEISGFESASSGTCDETAQSLEQGYFSLIPFLDTAEVTADGTLSLVSKFAGDTGFVFERAG